MASTTATAKLTGASTALNQELLRMLRGPRHERVLYVFENIRTKQVVYSLKRDLLASDKQEKKSLQQLTFVGKGSVAPEIREDLWKALAVVHFRDQDLCRTALHKLREYRMLREYNWRQNYANLKKLKNKQVKLLQQRLEKDQELLERGEVTEADIMQELAKQMGHPSLLDTDIEVANFRPKRHSQRYNTATKHSRHLQKWLQDRKKFLQDQKANSVADLAHVLKGIHGMDIAKQANEFLEKQIAWLKAPDAEFAQLKEWAKSEDHDHEEELKEVWETCTRLYQRGKKHPEQRTTDKRHAVRTAERRYKALLSLREARQARAEGDFARATELEEAVLRGCRHEILHREMLERRTLDLFKKVALERYNANKLVWRPETRGAVLKPIFGDPKKSVVAYDKSEGWHGSPQGAYMPRAPVNFKHWLDNLQPRPPIAPSIDQQGLAFRAFLEMLRNRDMDYSSGTGTSTLNAGIYQDTQTITKPGAITPLPDDDPAQVFIEWGDVANAEYVRDKDWPEHVSFASLDIPGQRVLRPSAMAPRPRLYEDLLAEYTQRAERAAIKARKARRWAERQAADAGAGQTPRVQKKTAAAAAAAAAPTGILGQTEVYLRAYLPFLFRGSAPARRQSL
ncbi:hypothetical protein EJ05DRAFT_510033 [Pseudovirgaria hyperparasitica]|uniref:Large ribosomal subunit protein mL67 n=1 Tax=Pseudovirgaria hyperparasitica TaxID=470096 RepID=A0A6A6WAX2_9PEZI|nr:uncharacterized protein EJ05DRAFT_510033 [Pseudovirgaria hyperparasitica]KAF2759184.1 hypothetical protein EJ05DRAFT_510033 [Pseudovirgaria hyperparasitica]